MPSVPDHLAAHFGGAHDMHACIFHGSVLVFCPLYEMMAPAWPIRRREAHWLGDEAHDGLAMVLRPSTGVLLGRALFANHVDCVGVGVIVEKTKSIGVVGADDGVTTDRCRCSGRDRPP